jgi:lipoprotein LprG
MSRTSRTLAVTVALALAVTGCSSKKDDPPAADANLPAAAQLLADGDKAMTDVKTTHFTVDVQGELTSVPVSHAEGDLTKEGSAKGTAKISQLGTVIEASFVILGDSIYLKAATGGYQKLPLAMAASVYDPSAILDPQRGAAKLLRDARNPQTQAMEKVDGRDAYKISFEPDAAALAALIPGKPTNVTAVVWLDAQTKRIAKAEFALPAAGSDPAGTVTVAFSAYDAPVTISAP